MTFILQRKSRAIFGFGVPGGASCSTSSDKEYTVQYASVDGTANTISCVNTGHTGTITVGGPVTQTTHWGGAGNAIWQQKDWETDSIYPYGAYAVPKCHAYGCYLDASCVAGSTVKNYYAIPRVNLTQTGTSPTDCTCTLQFDGDLLLPYETSISVWEEVNGVWTNLNSVVCPANTQSSPGGYTASVSITIPISEANKGKHYRARYYCPSLNLVGYADMYALFGSNSYDLPTINVSEHSFVTFGQGQITPTCAYDKTACLPVLEMDDVQFQMYVDVSIGGQYGNFPTPILGDGINHGTQLYLAPCDDCTIPTEIATAPDFGGHVAKLDTWIPVPGTEIYVNDYIDWSGLWNYIQGNHVIGDCFKICLCKRDPAEGGGGEWVDTILGCMDGCFELINDECYTTVLRFRSNNDELCFYYSQDANYIQSIRLPMYFRDVQYPSTSTGYQKSDGTWVKLSERIQEEWTLTTDWLEARTHKALKIALAHDTVIALGNMGINDQITAQNNYTINWESKTKPYPLAKGTVKVNKTINTCSVNTNC
jgi:hypothetical protein